jgi:deoxyxylulose-5-phosphate synthase
LHFLTLGYPDEFIQHGATKLLLEKYALDPASIADRIGKFIGL